jgi:hypothetical protein
MAGTGWQRCRVHFLRNVLARVPRGSAEMVAAAIRTVFAQPTGAEVCDAGREGRRHAAAHAPGVKRTEPDGPGQSARVCGSEGRLPPWGLDGR